MPSQRTYHVLGVPLRAGSLSPGNENDARAFRDADLLGRLNSAGIDARDDGDLAIPNYLPHHFIPPIRNWPAPRIVWDLVAERLQPMLGQPGHLPLLIGCDCSIVVGSAQALQAASDREVHVVYVDGDFDDGPPHAARCQSAAALGVWLLTTPSPFWAGPCLPPAQVTVVGASQLSALDPPTVKSFVLDEVRRIGPGAAGAQVLDAIPSGADILVHLDIDVFHPEAMPAAYFPHATGLTLAEGADLLGGLVRDPRVRIVEVAEYAALADRDGSQARTLVDLLATSLTTSAS